MNKTILSILLTLPLFLSLGACATSPSVRADMDSFEAEQSRKPPVRTPPTPRMSTPYGYEGYGEYPYGYPRHRGYPSYY